MFGVILSILDRKLRVEEDPLVKNILELLPGINCGACGFAGCQAFAAAVARQKDLFTECVPADDELNSKIAALIGKAGFTKEKSPLKIISLCSAKSGEKKCSFEYNGPQTCALADVSLANIDCRYGCLGFGDCVKVCPVKALKIVDSTVEVDYEKCVGCGKCSAACPRRLLEIVSVNRPYLYVVSCSNRENALSTKKVCVKGCIGCGICVKVIKNATFYLKEGLSKIDYGKDAPEDDMDAAKNKCPVKIIDKFYV